MTVTVLIADDQAMIRSGLRLILDDQPDITVVGEAADGAEAVAKARQLRPDVCLVDIRMPKLDGIEVTRALAGPGVHDPLRVVIVTTFDLDEYVYGALRAGAVGFILKDAGPALLAEAVRAASAGDALISPSITLRLLRRLAPVRATRTTAACLSDRETDVVRAVARGRTNTEVAAELFISLSTVKTHLASIQGKLGLRNRVEIAAWAWENCVTLINAPAWWRGRSEPTGSSGVFSWLSAWP
ncbi:MAG TPA: response regulator transcription factor [Streptosporangiaceae bacterium]|nr:response regulator transcription factor [Streptosporangiaceae bacterium]